MRRLYEAISGIILIVFIFPSVTLMVVGLGVVTSQSFNLFFLE